MDFPAFCVVLGLELRPMTTPEGEDGKMVAGVIYDPLRDEMFLTERGHGAWLNGRRIHVSHTAKLQEALTATGFPSHKRQRQPEHPLLPGVHAALAWGATGGLGGA